MTNEIKHYRPADSEVDLWDRMDRRSPTGGRIVCLKKLPHGAKYRVDRVTEVTIDKSQEDCPLSIQHYNPVVTERTRGYLEEVLRVKLVEAPGPQNP